MGDHIGEIRGQSLSSPCEEKNESLDHSSRVAGGKLHAPGPGTFSGQIRQRRSASATSAETSLPG